MTDAFDALAEPIVPHAPDATFALALRTRLRRALLAPTSTGDRMSTKPDTVDPGPAANTDTGNASVQQQSLTPYLAVADARGALDWYTRVLGAQRRGEPYVMEDGRIGHAELVLGDSVLMLADEYPEIGLLGPRARGGASMSLALQVADVDATIELALSQGAELVYPITNEDYGRRGAINDPYGHRWLISTPPLLPAPHLGRPHPRRRRGKVTSVMSPSPCPTTRRPGPFMAPCWDGASRRVVSSAAGISTGRSPPLGLWGGASESQVQLCYAVEDIEATVAEVRRRGGRAQAPQDQPYGLLAECTDDQGVDFQLWQAPRR